MKMKRLRTGLAAATGGAVLVTGLLAGASIAVAQETDTPEVTAESDSTDRGFRTPRDRARLGGGLERIAEEFGTTVDELRTQLRDGATLEELAEAAGVDIDALHEQMKQEALDAVDEKVAAGDLTQEQGDAIKERIESREPGERAPRGERGPRSALPGLGGLFGDLDIDRDALHELIEAGTSFDEALESLGVDVDALVAEATADALAHIDELVAEGQMTQERADEMKEKIESFDISEGLRFGPRGDRGRRGHGGGGGFGTNGPGSDVNAEGALFSA